MNKIIINAAIVFELSVVQLVHGQGTTYLSNLSQPSSGSLNVSEDSQYAVLFHTGNNGNGYTLNSLQLAMTDAAGNPSGFTVMIYTAVGVLGAKPGSSLGALDGSANPSTTGIYTYADVSNIVLSSHTYYFFLMTAATTVSNGSYELSLAGVNSYNPSGGWAITGGASSGVFYSNNGSSWNSVPNREL